MPVTYREGGTNWFMGHEDGPNTQYGTLTTQKDQVEKRSYLTVNATARSVERFLEGKLSEKDLESGITINANRLGVDPLVLKVEATIRFVSQKLQAGKLSEEEISTIAEDLGYQVEQLYELIELDILTQQLYADAYNIK